MNVYMLEGRMKCSIPDCEIQAIDRAFISINDAARKMLPVCYQHLDAANEEKAAQMEDLELQRAEGEGMRILV